MRFAATLVLITIWLLGDVQAATKTLRAPPPSSALQKVTNDLTILSRLANGIALQKEFNSKTIKVNDLLAELLGMDPNDNGMNNLLKIDLNKVPDDYAEIANQASSIDQSLLNASKVTNRLEILQNMGNDVGALKEGSNINLTEILNTATASLNIDKTLFTSTGIDVVINFYIKLNATFNLEGRTEVDATEISTSFDYLKKHFTFFEGTCKMLMNHEEVLKDLWLMNGTSKKLESVAKLAKSAQTYDESFSEIIAVATDMKQLNTEFTTLDPFFKKFSIMKSVAEKLNLLKKAFERLSSSKVSTRLLTAGFPRGTSDINLLFIDLKSEWLKEKIANNNETALNEMINDLDGLKSFNKKAELYEKSMVNFKETTKTSIQKSSDLWSSAVENEIESSTVQQLQKSASGIGKCVEELAHISIKADFVKFNESLTKLKIIDEASVKAKELFAQISQIKILRNETVYKSFEEVLDSVASGLNASSLKPTIARLKNNAEYQELLEGVKKASFVMKEIEKANIIKALKKNVGKWDEITNMQNVLNDTKLIDSLDCLMKNKLDNVGISKVFNFGSKIRSIGLLHKPDSSMVSFIKQAIHLKYSHANVTIPSSKSRSKRYTSSFDSLDNALVLSQDLGKGVNLLSKMADVYNNKNTLIEVASYEKEVFLEMKKVLNTIDTSSFPSELSKTVKDLDNLEEYAKKNSDGDLQNIGGVFEQASAIPGVPIDSKLFEDPISISFQNSPNENVKKTAPSFKVLGSLQLDYSNHRSDFKTSSLSIIKLKDYFDSFFMVPSSGSQYSQETMRKYLYGGGTVLVILILAAIIVVLILRTVYHKRKVNDSNTYRHLAFSGKEETLEVSKNKQSFLHVRWETLPLHDAIKKNDWKRFKKSVDEGANVNAYCADFVWRGTPLLLSIRAKLPIKFAQYLIKNGADLTLMDHQYKTPLMMAEEMGNREMVQMLKKCENKKYDRRLPPKFSHEEYRVHLFGSSDEAVTKNKLHSYTGEEEFREKFIGNETNKIEEATHIVVPTLEDGSVELDLSNISVQKLLPYFFGPKMIMKPIWLKASVENWKNFKNDFKFRVESVTINGNKYDTVVKIHGSIQERRLPFLLKIRAYFIGGTQEMWYPLAKSINALGGISHKHGCIPKQNDEQFFDIEGVSETPYFYHRDDLGPVFIFTDNREHLRRNRPFMFKYNMYHHIEPISFLELVFGFNTRHYKLYGGKEDKDTLVLDRFSQFNGIAKVRDEDPIDVEWPDLN